MDDVAPNLGDYLWLLKRRGRTLLLTGVLGAALGVAMWAVGPQGGEWASTAKIALLDDAQPLSIAMGAEAPPAGLAMAPIIEQVNSPTFRAAVLEQAGVDTASRVVVRATGDEGTRLVTLRVEGPSRRAADSLLSAAKEQLSRLRRDDLLDRYSSAVVALTARRDLSQQRLGTIDALISKEPADSPRTVALIHERVLVEDQRNDAAAGIAAFEDYRTNGDGGVRVVGGSAKASSASGLPLTLAVLVGSLLGLMGGVGVVLLRRFVRLPVDSRAALERCGATCVAVLGRSGGDRVAQAAVGQVVARGPLAILLARDVPDTVLSRLIPEPASSSVKVLDEISDVASDSPILLVVRAGTPEDEVRSLVLTAISLGADVVGAVLTDLPDTELSQALSR